MSELPPAPSLTLAHSTLAARDLDALLRFYTDTLGFQLTNRGSVPGGGEIAFISQDPANHHQIAMVGGSAPDAHAFMMVEHLAFRTGSLDDLRVIRERLKAAAIDPILPICHGNSWSLYFTDPEGNGLECFVDTPFHVAQPFAQPFDLDLSDAELEATTRAAVSQEDEYQPLAEWRTALAERLRR